MNPSKDVLSPKRSLIQPLITKVEKELPSSLASGPMIAALKLRAVPSELSYPSLIRVCSPCDRFLAQSGDGRIDRVPRLQSIIKPPIPHFMCRLGSSNQTKWCNQIIMVSASFRVMLIAAVTFFFFLSLLHLLIASYNDFAVFVVVFPRLGFSHSSLDFPSEGNPTKVRLPNDNSWAFLKHYLSQLYSHKISENIKRIES